MTDREKAIVMAYTGICMLEGTKFAIFHKYVEEIMGRPVQTIEMGIGSVHDEITERSRDDFMALCREDQEQCGDCISRKSVDRIINKWLSYPDYELKDEIYDMTKKIHKLPSVTPQPKMGRWIDVDGIWFKCSECDAHRKMMPAYKEYYCPNCGAKMSEIQTGAEGSEK